MASNIVRHWNNRVIRQREDGYLSGTDMAQANGKKLNDWLRLKSTFEFLQAMSESIGIPIDQLVQVNESQGLNEDRGTWIHPDIAPDLGTWCSIPFRVQVCAWIKELMTTGSVTIAQTPIPNPPPC